jgi:hypothetical protein
VRSADDGSRPLQRNAWWRRLVSNCRYVPSGVTIHGPWIVTRLIAILRVGPNGKDFHASSAIESCGFMAAPSTGDYSSLTFAGQMNMTSRAKGR